MPVRLTGGQVSLKLIRLSDNDLVLYNQVVLQERSDQATKGSRWMPRQGEAMKGVVSCDKPGGAADRL